jgi:hypothetical protein
LGAGRTSFADLSHQGKEKLANLPEWQLAANPAESEKLFLGRARSGRG